MVLNISIEGKGVIANCDSKTADTGGLGTGTWNELGGGTIDTNPDVYLYGNNSIGNQYASKSGYSYFDIQAGNELDFSVGGAEEGQLIYIWLNISAAGAFNTLANNGFSIRLATSITDYRDYKIAGSDDANGWTGGWKLFVIDPTIAGSVADTGTYDVSSIRDIGVWIDTAASVRADSIWIDQIAVGSGIRVTGTSTTGFKDIIDYCTDYANRAWGMFQERDGIYYSFGKLYIGDTTQIANTSFSDSGRIIQYGTSQFYGSGATWISTFPNTGSGIVIEDNATYTTTFSDGVIVGTDNGRSGSSIIGNADQDISLDLYGGNNAGSVTTLYGSTLKSCYGLINSGDDTDHKFLGVSFVDCSQFDPVGRPVIRNCTFAETNDVDSSLKWNSNIDIQKCSFIANTLGAAIEHTVITASTYIDLLFNGNTKDVLLSAATGDLTVNKTGTSNPITYESSGTGIVNFVGTKTLIIKIVDTEGNAITSATEIHVVKDSDTSILYHVEDVTTGTTTYVFDSALSGTDIYITALNVANYEPTNLSGITLPADDATSIIVMPTDRYYNNT